MSLRRLSPLKLQSFIWHSVDLAQPNVVMSVTSNISWQVAVSSKNLQCRDSRNSVILFDRAASLRRVPYLSLESPFHVQSLMDFKFRLAAMLWVRPKAHSDILTFEQAANKLSSPARFLAFHPE